jgi:hypothetical protein
MPALQELARAARSAEKLFDTLNRELPPTLEAIRLTGMEISDLTDEVNEGVKSASQVVKQVDRSVSSAKKQAQKAQVTTRSVFAGVKAAWQTWRRPNSLRRTSTRSSSLPPPSRSSLELRQSRIPATEIDTESLGFPQNDNSTDSLPEGSDREFSHADSAFSTPQYYEDEEDLEYAEDNFSPLTLQDESDRTRR